MIGMMAALQTSSEGLTLREVIRNLPHDGPAFVVYALVLGFVGFIWWGSRRRPQQ